MGTMRGIHKRFTNVLAMPFELLREVSLVTPSLGKYSAGNPSRLAPESTKYYTAIGLFVESCRHSPPVREAVSLEMLAISPTSFLARRMVPRHARAPVFTIPRESVGKTSWTTCISSLLGPAGVLGLSGTKRTAGPSPTQAA